MKKVILMMMVVVSQMGLASIAQNYSEIVSNQFSEDFQFSLSRHQADLETVLAAAKEKIAYDYEGASIHSLEVEKYIGGSSDAKAKESFVISQLFQKQRPFFCHRLLDFNFDNKTTGECQVELLKIVAPFVQGQDFKAAVVTVSGDDWGEFIFQVLVIENLSTAETFQIEMDVVYPL